MNAPALRDSQTLTACMVCGRDFVVLKSNLRRGQGKVCSKACRAPWVARQRRRLTDGGPEDIFHHKVDRSGGPDACWPYTGSRNRQGYGAILRSGRQMTASRYALLISGSKPPSEKHMACHTCDNPPCCNPAHLWWGTHAENMADATAKSRLNLDKRRIDRAEIYAMQDEGMSGSAIARRVNATPSTVNALLRARRAS